MREVDFTGLVEVYKRPNIAYAVMLIAAVILMAAVLVCGLLQGHFALLIVLLPFSASIAALRNAVSDKEMRSVPMGLSSADGVLRLRMSKARLCEGRYVDQFYLCAIDDIEQAAVESDGTVRLRARLMESFASDEGVVIDHRTNDCCEVLFKVDGPTCSVVESYLSRVIDD